MQKCADDAILITGKCDAAIDGRIYTIHDATVDSCVIIENESTNNGGGIYFVR